MKTVFIILFAVIILGAVVYVGNIYRSEDRTDLTMPPPTTLPPPAFDATTISIGQNYFLIRLGTDFVTNESHDFKIIYKNPNSGEETVLLRSVKDALPQLKSQFNRTIVMLSFPKNSSKIYFFESLEATDAPPGPIYAFDIQSRTFRSILDQGEIITLAGPSLSPDGWYLARIGKANSEGKLQEIRIYDLDKEKSQTAVRLSGNETLNLCGPLSDCLFVGGQRIEWVNNNTIRYSVYDNSRIVSDENIGQTHPLIEVRTATVRN